METDKKSKELRLYLEETVLYQKPEKGPVTHEKANDYSVTDKSIFCSKP